MTTVTIGRYPTAPRPGELPFDKEAPPTAEERAALAPSQKEKEQEKEPEKEAQTQTAQTETETETETAREVRVFSAPSAVRRRLPLRAVFAVRLLL
ncbi:MAG: hypothetical protein NC084_09515, partial [Bacteroides sp.]|nr:hypothetical protein [Bacteroides sp.]